MTRARSTTKVAFGDDRAQELAGALHEVSNALTVVLGWLDVARTKLPDGPEREALDVARTHARLGYGIARQAIGAEVPDNGSGQGCAHSVARTAVTGVTPEAARRNVRLVLDPATPDQSLTIAEVGSALQILTNLLLNAIAFTPAGGTVTLAVEAFGAQVLFAVTDEGPGISPDRARSLFVGPVSTRRGGAGVGLRHSHALAAAHGGKLSVIPSNEYGGGCFELTWPISEARSSTRPQPPLPLPSVRGSRVLVVEDDAAVRSLIELSLEARGAETTLVGEAAALERVLQNGRFDVALVDLSPIAEHCTEFFTRLRATNPDIAVILISGVASGVPHEIESQVSAWVRKPFEMGEVLDTMARLLSTQKLADEPETAVG